MCQRACACLLCEWEVLETVHNFPIWMGLRQTVKYLSNKANERLTEALRDIQLSELEFQKCKIHMHNSMGISLEVKLRS